MIRFVALLPAALLAAGARAETARLALVEDVPTRLTLLMTEPIERAVRDAGPRAAIVAVDEVPCAFDGSDYRFELPSAPLAAEADAVALESEAETAFVFPADPSFVAALTRAAADPASYRRPHSLRLTARPAEVRASVSPEGETIADVHVRREQAASDSRRHGAAADYRLRWDGRDLTVAVVGREYGGVGRLAAAVARASAGKPLTGLARGGTFGAGNSDARGRALVDALERAGLKYSAVSASEIEHWAELQAYRRERPDGVRYLSANLRSSGAPLLPPFAVFETSGARVAVVGLTPPWVNPLLARLGLDHAAVEDPARALETLIPGLRQRADVIVALGSLGTADAARLATMVRGLDLIVAEDEPSYSYTPPPAAVFAQKDRPLLGLALPPLRAYAPALNVIDVDRRAHDGRADWRIAHDPILLDDSLIPAEGYPRPDFEARAARRAQDPALIPPARAVFPPDERGDSPFYGERDFWTLAAGLVAERGRAEAGLLLSRPLPLQTVGPVRESLARLWLGDSEQAVLVGVSGEKLKALADAAADQKLQEDAGLPSDEGPRFVVSGFGRHGLLRGVPLEKSETYLVAASRSAAAALGLPPPYDLIPGTATVAAAALDELRARAPSASAADWRSWMEGRPLSETGLWRVNFRDISLNIRQTRTQSSGAFSSVVNSRIQGSDELLIGGVFKTDAEYLRRDYKWTNTLEMEYARDRIAPPGGPATTNVSANRIMFLTLNTERVGSIPYAALARSWGPSLGFQADSEFEATPGLPRKQVYSLFPGAEFFDGSVFKSVETTGILKRDLSRTPPNTQTGLRARALVSTAIGSGGARLNGELWNNYFFLTHSDNNADLRLEGDANLKLTVQLRKSLSVAPFVDFYWFGLKTRPTYGYSLMTGISVGFSRLWKPQYEKF